MAEEEKKEPADAKAVADKQEALKEEPKKEAEKPEEKPQEAPKEEPKKEAEKPEEKPAEEPKEEEEVEVPKKFEKLVKEIEEMSVLDLVELVKVLEKKFGVSAQAPVAAAAAGVAPEGEAAAEEKSEYNVVLKAIGEKKIEVIKATRDITGKGLKEAKDLVDSAASEPQTIKEAVKKEEAEEMKKKFEAAGATIELK